MTTLTAAQNASLARACTALRMGINKGHISLKDARALLAGNAQRASAALGLTIGCDADGVVTHDLMDLEVRQEIYPAISANRKADVLAALKELRADAHAAIERSKI